MNKVDGWYYYNHAILPDVFPSGHVDTSILNNKSIWKKERWGGRPILARWTSDFDCSEETDFWYTICDQQFDMDSLKAKRRNVIRNGLKYFDVKTVNPCEHASELYDVYRSAVESYGNVPQSFSVFHRSLQSAKDNEKWYVAEYKVTGRIEAYAITYFYPDYVSLSVLKANPDYERFQSNAALVHAIVTDCNDIIAAGGYINDGARNVLHRTSFQDYLEKYFGFRKAYCRLHVKYNPRFCWIVKLAYPMRKIFSKLDSIKIFHMLNGVLLMEEIVRKCEHIPLVESCVGSD